MTVRVKICPGSAGCEAWTVETPRGIGRIVVDEEDRSAYPSVAHVWSLGGESGRAYSRGYALRRLLRAGALPPPPVELKRADLLELAVEAETGEPTRSSSIIRTMLLRRTGRAWSVCVGSGSRRHEITISSLPRKRWRGTMTAADAAMLAASLDVDFIGAAGVVVGGRVGDRSRTVLAASGLRGRDLADLAWPAPRRGLE